MTEVSEYTTAAKVMALSRYAGVGPRLFDLLVNRYRSLDEILDVSRGSLEQIEGMTDELLAKVLSAKDYLWEADATISDLAARDITVVTRFDPTYPRTLMELNDPPPLLYVRGEMPDNDKKSVTVVGATEASNEGIRLAVDAARMFTDAGVQLVSSLRQGIDSAVHLSSSAAEHQSFAIIEGGFDNIDTTEQMPVAIDAVQRGGIISEYAPETEPEEHHYREVNRLLVGMSQAVVITELYDDSEEVLDVAKFCNDIGKLVFLVVDPEHGALSDKKALDDLTEFGAIPIVGLEQVDKIIDALV